jgi:hypothetical protein
MAKKTEQKIEEELKKLYGDKAMLDDDLRHLEQQYAKGVTTLEQDRLEELSYKIEGKKYQIRELQDKIDEVRGDKEELATAEEESRSYKWKEIAPQILEVIEEQHMSYNVETNKIIYCMDMASKGKQRTPTDIINPAFRTFDANRVERVMGKALNRWLFDANLNIVKLFMTKNKTHYQETASFFYSKWAADKVYNKARIVSSFWVEPDFDNAKDYNRDFDLLMYCIGGGKQENIDHLEQWPAYKLIFPERVANTPNLDIGGTPGGNGKGRYGELNRTIFTHGCVQPAAAKELNDGFNGNWEMATILLFDEPTEKELPTGKVKNATGGEEQRIERKGVDSYTADRNFSLLALSNNENGVFKLAGTGTGGEDRRYSVLSTNVVMIDEIMLRENCTKDQAGIRANEIAQLVKDRSEVAKWLAHVILKHDIANIQMLKPLHGIDYQTRFANQKSSIDTVFDEITTVLVNQGAIIGTLLAEIVNAKLQYPKPMNAKSVLKQYMTYLNKNKITYTKLDKHRLNVTFKGHVTSTLQGTVIEFTPRTGAFDWSSISTKMWHKGTPITIDDFKDDSNAELPEVNIFEDDYED